MSIAQNIRKFREAQAISLDQLASKTGMSIADCIQIEAGQRPLTSSEITSVCDALGISIDELIAEQEAAPVEEIKNDASVVMSFNELQNLLGMMNDK